MADQELTTPEFKPWPKIHRLKRNIVITEKIDGTNAQVHITDDGRLFCGSRNRWITPEKDNYGFARWVWENEVEIRKLGHGTHYGEWWGPGIQRGYGLKEKKFSLFNVSRWNKDTLPSCVDVVPVLYAGENTSEAINGVMKKLAEEGSAASPGFMRPEGIIVFHSASGTLQKWTFEHDEKGKEAQE